MNDFDFDFNFDDYDPIEVSAPPPKMRIENNEPNVSKTNDLNNFDFSFDNYDDSEPALQILQRSPEKEPIGVVGTLKDIGKQAAKNFVVGAAGTSGDILDLVGQRKGPILSHFPTSEQVKQAIESLGGPGEAETVAGKYAGRIGNLAAGAAALGGAGKIAQAGAAAAGVVGQTVEQAGGGPLSQAASEIITSLLAGGRGAQRILSSRNRVDQARIQSLRDLGYSDRDITLALNASKNKTLTTKLASRSERTNQAFLDFAENSEEMVFNILSRRIEGAERGADYVHALASRAYGAVEDAARSVQVTDARPFTRRILHIMEEVSENLGTNPENRAFIERLLEAGAAAERNPSAQNFMAFYRELNSKGVWASRSQKDRLIRHAKNGIMESFEQSGSAGRQLAREFDEVNAGIQKAYRAEDVLDLVGKAQTQDGMNFKKLSRVFDREDNVNLFREVLGDTETRNLQLIAKTGEQVRDFDKAWKSLNGINVAKNAALSGAAGHAIYSGNIVGLASIVGVKISDVLIRRLLEKSLTDPRFQSIQLRGLHALKNSSATQLKSSQKAMKEYLENNGIKIDDR